MAQYLRDTEAAEHLGISPKTLRAWRLQGRGPRYVKLGRAVRYLVQDLDQWASGRTIIPAQERDARQEVRS